MGNMKKRAFRCLTLIVTNQCPLQCGHCGPRSGPWAAGSMDLEVIIAALDEARERDCEVINFSGGEPFLLGNKLVQMIHASTERGLLTRVSTSAYWSKTSEAANHRLKPLAEAGLRQIFISSSDFHRSFVPLSNIIEATRAARNYEIEVYLVLSTSRTSVTCMRSVAMEFEAAGVDVPLIIESPIIRFGRAEDNIDSDELVLQPIVDFAGPCRSLTEHPTIRSDGRVTGCAVVFGQECAPLAFGQISREPLSDALDRMDRNRLAKWIHTVGVVELKSLIEATSSLRFEEKYVNVCHLCGDILGNPEVPAVLQGLGLSPEVV